MNTRAYLQAKVCQRFHSRSCIICDNEEVSTVSTLHCRTLVDSRGHVRCLAHVYRSQASGPSR